jgi:hypothetical protein
MPYGVKGARRLGAFARDNPQIGCEGDLALGDISAAESLLFPC